MFYANRKTVTNPVNVDALSYASVAREASKRAQILWLMVRDTCFVIGIYSSGYWVSSVEEFVA